jgi:hypothetical protein
MSVDTETSRNDRYRQIGEAFFDDAVADLRTIPIGEVLLR